jgi:hypothetical protein
MRGKTRQASTRHFLKRYSSTQFTQAPSQAQTSVERQSSNAFLILPLKPGEANYAIHQPMSAYIEGILAWPLSKVFPGLYWGRYDPHDGYVRTKRVPKALKRRRRGRKLSTERIGKASLSPLLQLPREVRDTIWEFVVGKMQVHWCTEDRRLKGYRCRSDEKYCQQQCLSWHGQPRFGVMNALLSCRQM